MITVVNKSTLVSNDDVALMARACYSQVRYHVAPIWGVRAMPVVYITDEKLAPPGAWVIAVLDDADQADALGWHTEEQGDVIYGRVFARPVLDNKGTVLSGELSVSSVLSHEVCETVCDPHVNLWADDGEGLLYALEVCDPVEDISYEQHVHTPDGWKTMAVSDFVTPAWFDSQADPESEFSYRDSILAPFTLTPGGYVVLMQAGQITEHFGAHYPQWRKETKKADTARSARRTSAGPMGS